ncbi:MAG: hypothetical protein ABSA72_11285 [Nitrososphaerales archaeon]
MEPEPERFEVEIRSKEKGLFVDVSPDRIVLGPRGSIKKAGDDDHVTVVMNGDRIDQAHRKVDGREVWHHTGEALEAHLDSLLANATETVDGSEFVAPNTYIVSVKRAKLLFSVVTLPFSVFITIFWRLFAHVEKSEDENRVDARVIFNQSRIQHLIQSAQAPLSLLARLAQKIPPAAFLKPMVLIAKRVLVNPQKVQNLNRDLLFVVSEKRVGFISRSDGGDLKFTSVVPLLEAYERLNTSSPVSLDDIGHFGTESEIRVKGSRNPTSLA